MLFPIGPILSREFPKSNSPYLETSPYVGHNPKTPQNDEGSSIDPPVDSPNAMWLLNFWLNPAAPPEEPPQLLSLSKGFLGMLSVFMLKLPNPNSSWEVFPMIIAPSLVSLSIIVALKIGF